MNDFPEELLEAVLLRLPASSQARFRAVSKPWLQLLTSQRFRKRTAELAITHGQHICGVIYSRDVHWEWAPPDRYRVHQVSLGFLPSHIQVGEGCPHLHFQEGLMVFGLPNDTLFVVNIANKTWRELPESRHDCSPSSLFCVLEADKEAPGFAVYAQFSVDSDLDEVDSTVENHWNVYDSSSNAWKPMMIKEDRSRPLSRREVFVTEESVHISGGTDIVHSDVYDRRSGKLVQSLPPWQEGTIPHIQYMRRFDQVFPLNFSTSEENLCEVWTVDDTHSAWLRWAVMPHGVLWPRSDDLFFTVWRVEVLQNIAFLTCFGQDMPVRTWAQFWVWFQNLRPVPAAVKLVAFDLMKATWKLLSPDWPCFGAHVYEPKPGIDVTWTGDTRSLT